MWRVRARVRDHETGDELDLRTKEAAADVRSALERADAGDLAPLPPDASPFRRFEVYSGQNGWFYITHAEALSIISRSVGRVARSSPRG